MRHTLEEQLLQAKQRAEIRHKKKKSPVRKAFIPKLSDPYYRMPRAQIKRGLIEYLFRIQKGRCVCCGTELGSAVNVDHIVPISRGGSNELSNLQLLSQQCNQQKGVMTMVEFMRKKRKKWPKNP